MRLWGKGNRPTVSPMVYLRPSGGTFVIEAEPASSILSYCQTGICDKEAGGVLLGRMMIKNPDVVTDTISIPTKKDVRSRHRFTRAQQSAQVAIARAWRESEGYSNYLGEWHTHPEDIPSPSGVDLADWAHLVGTAQFEQDSLFFVIAGREAVVVWELQRGSHKPVLLQPAKVGRSP